MAEIIAEAQCLNRESVTDARGINLDTYIYHIFKITKVLKSSVLWGYG